MRVVDNRTPREQARCGHYPWLEQEARDEFVASLREELLALSG